MERLARYLLLTCFVLVCGASTPTAQIVKPVYLSPIDGTGTDADPFRSRCVGLPGMWNIDLRPVGIARFACGSNQLPKDMIGIEQLGASLDERLPVDRKSTLDALAQKPLKATTAIEAIVELLSPHLRAGKDGKLKIWLGEKTPSYQRTAWVPFEDGGLIADVTNFLAPAVAWALTSASEDWNCTNATGDIDCDLDWVNITNLAQWDIVSSQAKTDGNFTTAGYANVPMDTVDHTASVDVVAASLGTGGTATSCAIAARQPGTATLTFYRTYMTLRSTGELNDFSMGYVITGTGTLLDTNTTDWVAGDKIAISPDGSTITGTVVRGGSTIVTMTQTDVNITTGNYGAFRALVGTADGNCTLDNFLVADNVDPPTGHNRGAVLLP